MCIILPYKVKQEFYLTDKIGYLGLKVIKYTEILHFLR